MLLEGLVGEPAALVRELTDAPPRRSRSSLAGTDPVVVTDQRRTDVRADLVQLPLLEFFGRPLETDQPYPRRALRIVRGFGGPPWVGETRELEVQVLERLALRP